MPFEADYAKNYASIMYQCLPAEGQGQGISGGAGIKVFLWKSRGLRYFSCADVHLEPTWVSYGRGVDNLEPIPSELSLCGRAGAAISPHTPAGRHRRAIAAAVQRDTLKQGSASCQSLPSNAPSHTRPPLAACCVQYDKIVLWVAQELKTGRYKRCEPRAKEA